MKAYHPPIPNEKIINFYERGERRATAVIIPNGERPKVGVSIRSRKEKQDNRRLGLAIARGRAEKPRIKDASIIWGIPSIDQEPHALLSILDKIMTKITAIVELEQLPKRAMNVEI